MPVGITSFTCPYVRVCTSFEENNIEEYLSTVVIPGPFPSAEGIHFARALRDPPQ